MDHCETCREVIQTQREEKARVLAGRDRVKGVIKRATALEVQMAGLV